MLNIEIGDTVELNNGEAFVVKGDESAPDLVWIDDCWYQKDTGLFGSSEDYKEYRFHVKRIISRKCDDLHIATNMLNIEIGDTVELNNGSSFVVKVDESYPDRAWLDDYWYHKDTGLSVGKESDKECRLHVKRIIYRKCATLHIATPHMLNIESGDTVELNNGEAFVVKGDDSSSDRVWIDAYVHHKDTGSYVGRESDKDYYRHVKRIISRNAPPYTESLLTCLI